VLFLNIIVLISLGLAYLAGLVSPQKAWPLAFVAMSYPIILGSTAVFMAYWLIRRRWFLFLNLAFLVLKWDYVSATFKFNTSEVTTYSGINVMTYNVRLFDKYNWSEDKNTRYRARDFIFNQRPNILCIQEYYNRKGDHFRMGDTLLEENGLKHMHLKNYYAQRKSQNDFGIATLTSYPIVNKGTIVLENSRSALTIFTDVFINEDTIRVYNVHLQSIHLGNKGYQVLDEILETQELEDVRESKLVLQHLKEGFRKRAVQADEIAAHIKSSPYPVIVCGDFNDVPTSYTYQRIAKELEDTFSQAGSGLGATYVRVPFFRIDNILYSKDFEAKIHTVHPYQLSDHLAVTAVLNKKE
jgi:endonuclease/exonuclease/phosphatase family metal-dependent hydrolase